MRVIDSSGVPSDSLTMTAVLLAAFVALAFMTAIGLTGEHGVAMTSVVGGAFGASLPLYYKRRKERDAQPRAGQTPTPESEAQDAG